MPEAPAPLYRDPIHDGPTDPVVIWNRHERTWWLVYTSRRADAPVDGSVAWVHGTALGVASSSDGGAAWTYRGEVDGLDLEWGRHTYWAPEIIDDGERYHMFVTCIRGVPTVWEGHARTIRHYVSDDLVRWRHRSDLALSSPRVIDACVARLPGGGWRLWYKDEDHGSQTWAADSPDLDAWTVRGPVVTHTGHEGPNVFELGGAYWMIVDEWVGQRVLRSDDLEQWEAQGLLLDGTGTRPDDQGVGHHADVVTIGGRAWAFYFTHPDRGSGDAALARRSAIQVAELVVRDGALEVDRDAAVPAPFLPIEGPSAPD